MHFSILGFDLEQIAVEQAAHRYPHLKDSLYVGNILDDSSYLSKYNTIIHQGVLEHFEDHDIMEILSIQAGKCDKIVFDVPNCLRENTEDEGDGTRFETPEFWENIIENIGLKFKRYGRTYDHSNEMLPKQLLRYDSDLMRRVGRSSIFVVEGTQNEL